MPKLDFKDLQMFPRILVVGPQRSGTRICAQMIAHDTGHTYIDESEFGGDIEFWAKEIIRLNYNCVVHGPGIMRICHCTAADLVIVLIRDIKEILQSQYRLAWAHDREELDKYGARRGPSCVVKYAVWKSQKKYVPRFMEIPYAELNKHPMWVDKKDRKGWTWNQTDMENGKTENCGSGRACGVSDVETDARCPCPDS